jgi:glucose/arabinose dehydrogenase
LIFAALSAVSALALVGAAPAISSEAAATTVRVSAKEFSFKVSRKSVPRGKVRFVVTNIGQIPHDFVIAKKKTPLLKHGEHATLTVQFKSRGRYAYRCSVAGHAAIGMRGVLAVGKPVSGKTGPPPPVPSPPAPTGIAVTSIGSFDRPDFVTAPPGDGHRVFVVEQRGIVKEVLDGVVQAEPFLDIERYVFAESETGLLSLAFAPDYATSGKFYVYFNDHVGNHNINVVEFKRSPVNPDIADPSSYRQVLTIEKPWENHNAGMMEFGPDGYLYIAVGDGDSGILHPPGAFGQTLDDLLGSILRIDPSEQPDAAPYGVPSGNPFAKIPGDRPEIWAYGLRNPWRFDLDPVTGDLYLGDVGEGEQEEIDLIPAGRSGENFGWPCFEGNKPFDATQTCANAVAPVLAYDHSAGACGVIAGVVARDPRLPNLTGRMLYADLCLGEIRSLRFADGSLAEDVPIEAKVAEPTSFGKDALGRIYVTSLADNAVYRLDPVP